MSELKEEINELEENTENIEQEVLEDTVEQNETVEDVKEEEQAEKVNNANQKKGDWYIIQTYSNHEHKVKNSLETRIQALNIQDKVFEILIPEEEVVEVKNNKKIEKVRKMYPGYIFVRMLFDDELWYVMKRVPGLSKFMGDATAPVTVRDEEMLKVLRQVGVKVQKFQVDFEVGDMVKIIAGPFRGYNGPVKEINAEKGKIKSTLLIFGRETPVEISFDQIEKVTE